MVIGVPNGVLRKDITEDRNTIRRASPDEAAGVRVPPVQRIAQRRGEFPQPNQANRSAAWAALDWAPVRKRQHIPRLQNESERIVLEEWSTIDACVGRIAGEKEIVEAEAGGGTGKVQVMRCQKPVAL